ncbi:MAG: hypothetical protein ACLUUO_05740 [Sellimonas intestinalis]
MEDSNEEIQNPSDSLDVEKGEFSNAGVTVLSYVDIDSDEYRRKIDTKVVRKNVSLPCWLNYEADSRY